MSRRVLKWSVDASDSEQYIGAGPVVFVASQGEHATFYVWTLETDAGYPPRRSVRVFGTGHPLPDDGNWEHVGSCQAGPFVWHVFTDEPF